MDQASSEQSSSTGQEITEAQARAARRTRGIERMSEIYNFEVGDGPGDFYGYTLEHLFGDIWERPGLSKRDRSMITVATLIALNRPDQLRSHLALARQNGVTEDELVETITHLAFYAGWPSAVSAVAVARDVFKKN